MWFVVLLFVGAMASADGNSTIPLENQIDKASMKMLKEAYLESKQSNVVTSPLGVLLLLALYSSGTEDQSKDEIMSLLGSNDYKELTKSYTSLGDKFASMDSSFLTLANKVYVAKGLTLDDDFSNAARSYKSEIDSIDFTDTNAAVDIINQWAAEKTRSHIKNPVSEELIDKNAVVALFNIIFFQGHWQVPFKAEETKDKDFHVNISIAVKKPMMHLIIPLNYHEDKEMGARLIQLPYKEEGFFMTVILPDEVDGLASVVDKVAEKGLLQDIFSFGQVKKEINLYIPKFDITSKLDYKSILPKLGVKRIFSDGATGIVKGSTVTVSEFFQEAIVKVDEEGATAGAFTGMVGSYAKPETIDFIVDHPFLFAIQHRDVILFTGIYFS